MAFTFAKILLLLLKKKKNKQANPTQMKKGNAKVM